MAAVRLSPIALRRWLVRLGRLSFDDFRLLGPQTLLSQFTLHNSLLSDWSFALNNAPHIELHFRAVNCSLQPANCKLAEGPPSLADVEAAQKRLVTHFAYELLRAKAPPLYDALPWQDWDFSIVAKRFKLWQTRFLLAGDGTTVTMCRCRKSAGVYVVEPDESIARYIERKAVTEKIRRFRLLRSSLAPSLPLPPSSVDLAIIGSSPDLQAANCRLVILELLRVAADVLLIENNPLSSPLDEKPLTDAGFRPDSVAVAGLGLRRCWWRTSRS